MTEFTEWSHRREFLGKGKKKKRTFKGGSSPRLTDRWRTRRGKYH